LVAWVTFVHLGTGRPLAQGSVRCRAEVDGKRLRVVTNAFAAQAATCAWRIPGWAKGKQLTGVVAVQIGDAAARRLFVRTID
jgi:putative Ca2+/H+ antiporter (TMEM165/GDT1 family)